MENGEGSAPTSHASTRPDKRGRSSRDSKTIGNRLDACRSSGTGVSGRQPTAFPPVAAFQKATTPEGSEATPAANRTPSRTPRPRSGMLRPGVDHREDERLPFVRGMDMVRDRGIIVDAVPFLENVGEVPETHRHFPGEDVEELLPVVGAPGRAGLGERLKTDEEGLRR